MNLIKCSLIIATLGLSAIYVSTHTINLNPLSIPSNMIRKLVSDIRQENVRPLLNETRQATQQIVENSRLQLQQLLAESQYNIEFVTRRACCHFLYLATGIAGLSILATSVMVPIIKKLCLKRVKPQKESVQRKHIFKKYMPYVTGLILSSALLAMSYAKLT